MRPILIAGVALASFAASAAGKHHLLKATPESVQWGWLDPSEPPKLTIDSGDTVSIETLLHARDQIQKGVSMEKIVELRKANPGGGPHSVTGPIAVNGAEPGDVLEIRILKIVPKKTGFNFNLPGKEFPTIGALAKDYPEGYVKYFDIDPKAKTIRFKPGIEIPLRPFRARSPSASTPKTRRRARAAPRNRWRRSARCGRGRTGPTWTSTR